MENLEELKEVIPEVQLGNSKILFLDVSSSCTGFTVASVDFINKKAEVLKAGAIWLDDHWEHARKYDYLYSIVQTYFEVVEQIDHIVVEQYSVNPKKMTGVLVSPEVHGCIKAAAFSNGVKVSSILPQSWRSSLGIKAIGPKGKRDYKTPTKDYINTLCIIPQKIISNISEKERQTPSDLYDSLGITLGWLCKFNIKAVDFSTIKFQDCVKF
jgi:Holliday junction resolvasome RuvABC endonuclease subunit